MIRNTRENTSHPPRLRIDINYSNAFGLPAYSTGPEGEPREILQAVRQAGFEGIQTGLHVDLCREIGLRVTGGGRIDSPEDAQARAIEARERGYDCVTVHIGRGIEGDAQVDTLVTAMIRASEQYDIPIYLETHRATITQDIWRTVQLVKRIPDVRFNGDFSHYYTGLEMTYGDIEAKWQFMQPIFDRVRFIHARIGNSGCMQVDIGDGSKRPYVEHFKEMWTRSFMGFLKSAKPGDVICFTPELLGPPGYAREFPNAVGAVLEEGDRWQQALVYARIARKCWDQAVQRLSAAPGPAKSAP